MRLKRVVKRGVLKSKWDLENDKPKRVIRDPLFDPEPPMWFMPGPDLPRLTVVQSNIVRAKKRGLVADLTKQQWDELKIAFWLRCAYCGHRMRLELEHFIPLSKGGGTTVTNMVPACEICNAHKRNYDPIAYFMKREDGKMLLDSIRTVLNKIGAAHGKQPVSW